MDLADNSLLFFYKFYANNRVQRTKPEFNVTNGRILSSVEGYTINVM